MVRAFKTTSLACVAMLAGLSGDASAQQVQPPQKGKPPAAAAPAAPAAPVQVPTVQRSEVTQFGSWRVTCSETDVSKRKTCSAVLNGLDQNKRPVLTWIMGRNNEGAMVTVLQTPQTQAGLQMQKGVELKLGNGNPRKLDYLVCNQARCESVLTMDEAMMRELGSVSGASVTIYRADGQPITINLPTITGADKALSTVARG